MSSCYMFPGSQNSFPGPPDTFPGYIDWTRFDGNVDNLIQEMSKIAWEIVHYVRKTCEVAKDICYEVHECVTRYRK